jgi:hypothetical protein
MVDRYLNNNSLQAKVETTGLVNEAAYAYKVDPGSSILLNGIEVNASTGLSLEFFANEGNGLFNIFGFEVVEHHP